ncbi:MAG: hypothetical protein OEV20_11455, partial [Actinomycetota bacterium]|nr:hypothetical protein [Actinomycetota bacterium]
LLKELGSLRAVREADVDKLTQVTGISQRNAETIHRFFAATRSVEAAQSTTDTQEPAGETSAEAVKHPESGAEE